MKRLSKIFVLVLTLALLCGVVFAVMSSAADETPKYWYTEDLSESVTGATRKHRDFTGEVFDNHRILDGTNDVPAGLATTKFPNTMWPTGKKTGHFRSVTTPDGNTYYEYAVRVDRNDGATGKDDAVVGVHPNSSTTVNGLSYVTFEFDMMTPTDFPAAIKVFFETRYYNGSTEYTGKVHTRGTFATYTKEDGAWAFGEGQLALDAGEWAHITLVFQINKTVDTDGTVNYKDTVAKAYANGQYMGTITNIFPDKATPADVDARIYYCGVGYAHGNSMAGTKADDAIALDNMVYTTYTDAYATDANAKLPSLFAENAATDIAGLGVETVWTNDYAFPTDAGDVEVIDAEGNIYGAEDGVLSAKSAIAFIKENGFQGATLKLYSSQYNPLYIDFPVELTIDYNGYTLKQGYEVLDTLAIEYDTETNKLTVSNDAAKLITINYYDGPKDLATAPALTQTLRVDVPMQLKTAEVTPMAYAVSGKIGYTVLATYSVYDQDGNQVDALPETVSADLLGETYSVYYDYQKVEYENTIKFAVTVDGVTTFYHASNDLWSAAVKPELVKSEVAETTDAGGVVTKTWTETQYPTAIPSGARFTLFEDATISAALFANSGDVYVDLNGYKLTTSKTFVTASKFIKPVTYTQVGGAAATSTVGKENYYIRNNRVYFYSSAAGAEMETLSNVVEASDNLSSSNDVAYYFGYSDKDVVSANRITIRFGERIVNQFKGNVRYIYFANLDLYNTIKTSNALVHTALGRGLDVYFLDTNLYTQNMLVSSGNGTSDKTLNFTNSNVYAEGGLAMNYIHPDTTSNSPNGSVGVNLINSKIYGMKLGDTEYINSVNGRGSYFNVLIRDTASRISDKHDTRVQIMDISGTIVAKPETVTIDGVTYSTLYGVGTGEEETARFEFYDIIFEQYTAETTPTETLDVVAGYWFATILKPTEESLYYYELDRNNIFNPQRYSVHDSEGNVVPAGAAVAGETYRVFIECTKTPVSIAVIDAEGNATPCRDNNISKVPVSEGSTVVLLADECIIYIGLSWKNVKLDLNGKTVYNTVYTDGKRKNAFTPAADSSIFVYSSAEGAKYYQAVEASSSGYVAYLTQNNSYVYFGYQDADTLSPYRIDLHCGAFAELRNDNNGVYLGNLNIYKLAGDNYGFLNFREGAGANRNIYVENCNIYMMEGNVVALRKNSANGQVTFKNTNFFVNSSGGFVSGEPTTTSPEIVLNFENVGIYGKMASIGYSPEGTKITVNIKGTFTAPFVSNSFVYETEGLTMLPYGSTVKLDGHTAAANGVYGQADAVYFQGDYASLCTLGAYENFKTYALQNMTMDTNVVANLYIPRSSGIVSAKIGETEIFDAGLIETIGDVKYYVLSFGVAPKYGDRSATITVTLGDGQTVDFEMSVARYAKKLLAIEAEEGTYVADAKQLMKYILTYIKEVALKYGGADEETIFADLGDITVDTNVKITEPVHDTSAIKTYVTHAALNLDAYAGFAFKVAEGFIGTVKVELAGVDPVEKTYTAETPAGELEVIVLENVPVHIFRGDVVITVTLPAESEEAEPVVVSASFNLATYAATYDEAYVKALYAYSIAAKEFNKKYPTVGTAKG